MVWPYLPFQCNYFIKGCIYRECTGPECLRGFIADVVGFMRNLLWYQKVLNTLKG